MGYDSDPVVDGSAVDTNEEGEVSFMSTGLQALVKSPGHREWFLRFYSDCFDSYASTGLKFPDVFDNYFKDQTENAVGVEKIVTAREDSPDLKTLRGEFEQEVGEYLKRVARSQGTLNTRPMGQAA